MVISLVLPSTHGELNPELIVDTSDVTVINNIIIIP